MKRYEVLKGGPEPPGATRIEDGTNFSVFSEHAERVELLIFEPHNTSEPAEVVPLKRTGSMWHCFINGVSTGYQYAYRADGPYEPRKGQRFNPNKMLIDPRAKAIAGTFKWDDALLGYRADNFNEDLSFSREDSGPCVPRCVVVDSRYNWEDDKRPEVPWEDTIIYETHVKGMTKLHPEVEESKRGTYTGLAYPCIIDYLKKLGVTAVELLPVQHILNERSLYKKKLTNYWGYNTIGYFAPDGRYSSSGSAGEQVTEFKDMVKALHRAGIEVILDVVYNHTAEGDKLGPTVCFRGLDNTAYYHLDPKNRREYLNYTGCGNSFNMTHPGTESLVRDSLRYWIEEMHVDGFRFDLAVTLSRNQKGIDKSFAFYKSLLEDPVLSKVKLMTESWDIGENGYQLGAFPPRIFEWNDKYRDALRRYWNCGIAPVSEVASRLAGSPDIFKKNRGAGGACINYVTVHDGFTLSDLVSYNKKHNAFNKEGNRDGADENYSWNCGEEGTTENAEVINLRERQKRNLLAALMFSRGVPMILGGDEIGRTQRGNNNAYCQDNRITWYDWDLDERKKGLLCFTERIIDLRKKHPALRGGTAKKDGKAGSSALKDIRCIKTDGCDIGENELRCEETRPLGMYLEGDAADRGGAKDKGTGRESFLLLMNPCNGTANFVLPAFAERWELLLYTLDDEAPAHVSKKGEGFTLVEHSLALFRASV